MKNIVFDISNIQELLEKNCVYVDKTEYIYQMVSGAGKCYFLSRPRRFGKSLTVSTLKAIFQGKKELFNGLYIGNTDYDWKTYPIIHLTMNAMNTVTLGMMEESIADYLSDYAKRKFSLDLNPGNSAHDMFRELVETLGEKMPVVILIDEYDKPLLDHVGDPEFPKYLAFFKNFYGIVKACVDCERFVFITGASKFSHVSLFSDLNNLIDISHRREYATMLGYTQEELEANFGDRIEEVASVLNMSIPDLKAKIKKWYNGFHFHQNAPTVYNPVSIAQFFSNNGEFSNYWFSTGTPSFLFKSMNDCLFDLESLKTTTYSSDIFDAWEPGRMSCESLFLQSGYLTIDRAVEIGGRLKYCLRFPNYDVEEAFRSRFINYFYPSRKIGEGFYFTQEIRDAVYLQDLPKLERSLKSYFAGLSYEDHHKDEYVFKALFAGMFRYCGLEMQTEVCTIDGRMDACLAMPEAVYIFEFKLDDDKTALEQIRKKGYYDKYLSYPQPIYIIGCNFDSGKGTMTAWRWEKVDKSQQ